MEVNLGSADRMTRLILGTALLYAALLLPNGWGILLIAVALVALVSGATGRCLIYRLLGLSIVRRATHAVEAPRTMVTASSPDELVDAVRKAVRAGRVQRLTVHDGDWTVIDIPLMFAPSGVLEVSLLEFLRARAEVAGYPKLTVRH